MTRPVASGSLSVVVVGSFGILGGAERWLLRLLDATDRLSVRAVLLGSGELQDELRRRGIPTEVRQTGAGPAELARRALSLVAELRREPPEVVLANGVKAAAVAVPACRLAGVPVVWAKHDRSFDRRLAAVLGRLADRVVAVTEEIGAPTGRRDVAVVPPPRPERAAAPARARRFWAARDMPGGDGPVMAMATRLLPYKGVDDAIAALALPAAGPWRLAVIGADDYAAPGETARLRDVARAAGVADRVWFAGPVEDAGRWLAAFDAVGVLTRTDPRGFGGEGFPTAALEAFAAGVPVVATGPPALARLSNGSGAELIAPGSPRAVAEALGRLTDEDVRRRGGRAARNALLAHPDAETCAARLAAVLSEAARRPGAALTGGPPLSVVTTVLNEREAVGHLLASLAPQLGDEDEIVVVDGGSTDGTADVLEGWSGRDPRVRSVSSPGANISAGRNAGIAAARHHIVACTDAGCEPSPGWLDALRRPFAEKEAADLVAGVYRVSARTPFEHAVAAADYPVPEEARRPGPLVRAYGRFLGRTFDPTLPTGRSVAFTREAWRAAGGFPERLETAEDVTFGRAVAGAGGRCVLSADAEVSWEQRRSVAASARMYQRYGYGDGLSGDRLLIVRNMARLAAYGGGAALWVRGGPRTRAAIVAGTAAYLSLPVARARKRPRPLLTIALVPAALALKDIAKAAGCLRGLASRAVRLVRAR